MFGHNKGSPLKNSFFARTRARGVALSLAAAALMGLSTLAHAQLTCRTDSLGTTRCDNGTTFRTDSLGTTRDNHGNSWRTDSLGVTRGSDGTTCRKDALGTVRCY